MDTALERLVWQRARSQGETGRLPRAPQPLRHAINQFIARHHPGLTGPENLAPPSSFWKRKHKAFLFLSPLPSHLPAIGSTAGRSAPFLRRGELGRMFGDSSV